jgi:hypothetical protein
MAKSVGGLTADRSHVWAHTDAKGFDLRIDYLPLNDAEIVVRVARQAGPRATGTLNERLGFRRKGRVRRRDPEGLDASTKC